MTMSHTQYAIDSGELTDMRIYGEGGGGGGRNANKDPIPIAMGGGR